MNGNYVTAGKNCFMLNEKPFRFVGANMYELANADSATTRLMIKDAFDEGFTVLRFWAFEPMPEDKLEEICNIVSGYKFKIIPVLADPSGYLQNYKIDADWYKEGYKKSYLKYASNIVNVFKDREEILLWELINEPVTNSFEDIYNFSKDVSEIIRSVDPNHLISIGTIGGIGDSFGDFYSRFKIDNFEKLYSIETLDAISIHDYSFDSTFFERLDIYYRLKNNKKTSALFNVFAGAINFLPSILDQTTLQKFNRTYDFPLTIRKIWRNYNSKNIAIAKKLGKPLYIGEIGFKKSLNEYRKIILEKEFKKYFNEGVSGILLWSFESQGRSLDGHDYGFNSGDNFGKAANKVLSQLNEN